MCYGLTFVVSHAFGPHITYVIQWYWSLAVCDCMSACLWQSQAKSSLQPVSPTKTSSASSAGEDAEATSVRTRRVRFNDGHLTSSTSTYSCNLSSSSSCSSPVDSLAPQSHVRQQSVIHSLALNIFRSLSASYGLIKWYIGSLLQM